MPPFPRLTAHQMLIVGPLWSHSGHPTVTPLTINQWITVGPIVVGVHCDLNTTMIALFVTNCPLPLCNTAFTLRRNGYVSGDLIDVGQGRLVYCECRSPNQPYRLRAMVEKYNKAYEASLSNIHRCWRLYHCLPTVFQCPFVYFCFLAKKNSMLEQQLTVLILSGLHDLKSLQINLKNLI